MMKTNSSGFVDILLGLGVLTLALLFSFNLQSRTRESNRVLINAINYFEGMNQGETAAVGAYFAHKASLLQASDELTPTGYNPARSIASAPRSCEGASQCPKSYTQTKIADNSDALFRRFQSDRLLQQVTVDGRYCGSAGFGPSSAEHRVCLVPKRNIQLTILASAGGVLQDIEFDTTTLALTVTSRGDVPAPAATTIKNLPTARRDYFPKDLCLYGACLNGTFQDAAETDTGQAYYLSSSGSIIRRSDLTTVNSDPKIQSIDFIDPYWLFLRSDGAILTSNDIESAGSYIVIAGLRIPWAERIVSGAGP